MPLDQWTQVDRYFADLFAPADPVLTTVLESSRAAGLPAINVSPNQGKLLLLLARLLNARNILEIGTLAGYSTIWLARGLAPGGRVVTLEVDPQCAEIAQKNFVHAGLAETIELRLGPALDTLPKLAAEGHGPFDLVFIDADKPSNPAYWEWALQLTRPGSLIVADNVVRDGAVVDAQSVDPKVQGTRRMLELMAADPRVSATALQTVGIKGYDGFAIALVTKGKQF